MTEPGMDATTGVVTASATASATSLARVHLRSGAMLLARAELEALLVGGSLAAAGLVDLAEARWRTGDLDGAAVAAGDHQAAGGTDAMAHLILAEAAAAAGRPDEAERHVAALGTITTPALGLLFAGMPRRADWSARGSGVPDPGADVDAPRPTRSRRTKAAVSEAAGPGPAPGTPAGATSAAGSRAAHPDGETLLRDAESDLRSTDPERTAAAFDRLALALRWHPSIAADVVELVARRPEPAALLVRGDALRTLGRFLEAEAAYAAAAAALTMNSRSPT